MNRTLIVAFLFLISSCEYKNQNPNIGFYFWRSKFNLTESQFKYLDSLEVKRLYIKAFDVDTSLNSNGDILVEPSSILYSKPSQNLRQEIVPVVYLTRASIIHSNNIDTFALQLHHLLNKIIEKQHWVCNEIQLDYDWTPSTRDVYFDLLNKLKQFPDWQKLKFSATIRLHQIKNRNSAGIPPVDKGLLMCYNMGNLKQYSPKNSILDLDIMDEYLTNLNSYPLKLDVALPLFSWVLQFQNKKFKGILNNISASEIETSNCFEKSSIGYEARCDGNIKGFSFHQKDELKVEFITQDIISRAYKKLINKNINTIENLIFFDLNLKTIHQFPTHEIKNIYQNN